MNNDCTFTFRLHADHAIELTIAVRTLGPNPRRYTLAALDLPPELLARLRNAEPGALVQVTAAVDVWLAKSLEDLPVLLEFAGQRLERWRLIFRENEPSSEPGQSLAIGLIPFEALTLDGAPLVLHQRIGSFTHLVPKIGSPPSTALDWPLRILFIRSNPSDTIGSVGDGVPPALPLRTAIMQQRPELAEHIQIDVISSEPPLDGVAPVAAPQIAAIERWLKKNPAYHIVVYLGHGDSLPSHDGIPPSSVLLLEDEGGLSMPIREQPISQLLHDHPAPLVLLVGCLTAAAALSPQARRSLPNWIGGGQGVAQALLSGFSAVQCVIGTRARIDELDALELIGGFFGALLGADDAPPGHVEAALRAARSQLAIVRSESDAWAALALYSTLPAEPLLRYIATPPTTQPVEEAESQTFRINLWNMLAATNGAVRASDGPNGALASVRATLTTYLDNLIRQVGGRGGAAIYAMMTESRAGAAVDVPIVLSAPVELDELELTLTIGDGGAQIIDLIATKLLADARFTLLRSAGGAQIGARLRCAGGTLPAGEILIARINSGTTPRTVYPLTIEALRAAPSARSIVPIRNALIVPLP